jgi:hypothetical protein
MLFSFTVSAQVDKGAKKEKPVKGQSSYTSDSKPKPGSKPSSLKPANEVNNDRPTKPVGKGTTSVNKPNVKEKSAARPQTTTGKEQRDPSAARSAARPQSTTGKEQRDPSAARSAARPQSTTGKEQRDPSAARSAARPQSTTGKEQRDPASAKSAARPQSTTGKEQRDPASARNSSKTSAAGIDGNQVEFCKGWKDGYIKGWNIDKDEFEKPRSIPECDRNANCEGYKCGYKMGMKKVSKGKWSIRSSFTMVHVLPPSR